MEGNDKEEEKGCWKPERESGRGEELGEGEKVGDGGGGGNEFHASHFQSFAVYFVCLCSLAPLALKRAALRITMHVRCISMNCKGD